MPATLPQAKSGKLRALGVSSLKRATAAPDVPTIAEGGVAGFEVLNWYGITLPGGTSQAIVRALNQDLLKALATPAMIEAFNAQGNEVAGGTPAEFAAFIKSEMTKYAKVVKAANIRAE